MAKMSSLALAAYLAFGGGQSVASAFLQHPTFICSEKSSAHGPIQILKVKEDVSDAAASGNNKIQEEELDEAEFLAEMDSEIMDISILTKDSGILDSTATTTDKQDVSSSSSDVCSRAIAKMEAMAQESIEKHAADMQEFAELKEKSSTKNKRINNNNGPIVAFSLLGAAIGAGMIATAPEAITGIDLSTFGLPVVDISGLNVDLPALNIPTIEMSEQVDIMKEALANTKETLLDQTETIRTSLPGSMDGIVGQVQSATDSFMSQMNELRDSTLPSATGSILAQVAAVQGQVREVTDSLPGQVQAAADSFLTQVDPLKANIFSQMNELRDSTLPSAKDSILAQVAAVQGQVREVTDSLPGQVQAAADSFLTQVDPLKANIFSQMNELRDSTLPSAKDSILAQVAAAETFMSSMEKILGTASGAVQNLQYFAGPMIADAKAAGVAQLDAAQATMNDMQATFATKFNQVLEEGLPAAQDPVLSQVGAIKTSLPPLPAVDIDTMIEHAKIGGEGILNQVGAAVNDAQVSLQSQVSNVDISTAMPTFDLDGVIGKVGTAVDSIEMPVVDTALLADRAKIIQEAIEFKVSNIEIPSIDVPSIDTGALSNFAKDAVE